MCKCSIVFYISKVVINGRCFDRKVLISIVAPGPKVHKYLTPIDLHLIFENQVWKIKFDKSSLTNWIFNLKKPISKLIFAGYTGSKIHAQNRLQIKFVKLDLSNLIFKHYFSNIKFRSIGGLSTKRWRNFRMNSWSHRFSQNTRENILRISALASKWVELKVHKSMHYNVLFN